MMDSVESKMPAASLDQQMTEALSPGGFRVSGGSDVFMELADTTTGLVWMTSSPVTREEFHALEVEAPFVKVGAARASMDAALFQASPGAADEPVREREIYGRHYINVASPGDRKMPTQAGAPMEIRVDKHHVIGFEAGRRLTVLSLPEGDFVEVVGDSDGDEGLVLPEGGTLRSIEITQPWVVHLPSPTRAFFWLDAGMRSFQGPVTLPEHT